MLTDADIGFLERSVEAITPDDIEKEMRELPSTLAFANARFASAHNDYLLAKLVLEREEARLYLSTRSTFEAAGAKFTEKTLDSTVKMSDEYNDDRRLLIVAEVERERLKGFCITLAAKREMLVSIGMRINAELRMDPIAAAQARGARG